MALRLLIDGVDRTTMARQERSNVTYTDDLNTRTTLRIGNLVDPLNVLELWPGESVLLEDVRGVVNLQSSDGITVQSSDEVNVQAEDVDKLFGGTIERTNETLVGPSTFHRAAFEAVSYDQIADRHNIAEIYENATVGDIARDIVSAKLAADGVTADAVEDGPLLEFVLFDYLQCDQALDKICELGHMIWWIDARKVLHLQVRTTTAAPFALTDGNYHGRNLSWGRTRERYRTRQIIRSGLDLTDPRTEQFVGDTERRTFTLAFPIGTAPTVTVDFGAGPVAQTVGIKGLETSGKDWYWNKDSHELSQDDAATPLDDLDVLAVTYQGLTPNVVIVQDDAEVTARKAEEGGSGIYERVADEPNIDSATVAVETALAHLQRDGMIPTTLTLGTWEKGLRAGQILSANLTRERLAGDFLITSVTASFLFGDTFEQQVVATDGGFVGGWVEYFNKLAASQRAAQARAEESLIVVRALSANVLCDATLHLQVGPPETRIGFMEIGTGEIGA